MQLAEFETMSKVAVRVLADDLRDGTPDALERCVRFVCAETEGVWHGRGRAMMCRRMKHVDLSGDQRSGIVSAILQRLASGHFAEQFRDQLRLAIHLDPANTFTLARCALKSEKDHVRRLAHWVLSHENATVDAQPSVAADAPRAARR
jgi:hypothetical protein